MFNTHRILFCLDDIAISPASVSEIEHRSECNIFKKDENGNDMLPLFTAPMLNVVDVESSDNFMENKITPIIPRTESLETRLELCKEKWCAFSLSEFKVNFIQENKFTDKCFVLIDIANGNMKSLMDLIKEAKRVNSNIVIMAGNVANALTFKELALAGADYVRVSIGTGAGCITASNTAIFKPMASLIADCYLMKIMIKTECKIVADGGMKSYSDIIKALALGADYVMCGSIFNKMVGSAGEVYSEIPMELDATPCFIGNKQLFKLKNDNFLGDMFKRGTLYKEYFGMSTKKAQKAMGKENLHTSEGKSMLNKIEYTMEGWVENFSDYLRSAMSYCNIKDIEHFNSQNLEINVISTNSSISFNK